MRSMVLLCSVVIGVSASATALTLELATTLPKEGEHVHIVIREDCGAGHGRGFTIDQKGTNISVMIQEINCPCEMICAQVCTPLVIHLPLGPLPAGEYTITATYRVLDGCDGHLLYESSVSTPLVVAPKNRAPLAFFSFTPARPKAGGPVTFDASLSNDPDGEVKSFLWRFAETAKQGGAKETWVFPHPGTYMVELQIVDDLGATGSARQTVVVEENQPPVALFCVLADPPRVGLPITFDLSCSFDPDGSIVWYGLDWENDGICDVCVRVQELCGETQYSLDFGCDNVIEKYTPALPPVAYKPGGEDTQLVTLVVRDDCGGLGTHTFLLNIEKSTPELLADFRWVFVGKTPSSVAYLLDATLSQGAIVQYIWDWNSDGQIDEETEDPIITGVFPHQPPFLVTLIVRDNGDQKRAVTKIVGRMDTDYDIEKVAYIPNQVIIRFRAEVDERGIEEFISDYRLVLLDAMPEFHLFLFALPDDQDVISAIVKLREDGRVKNVEPNYLLEARR